MPPADPATGLSFAVDVLVRFADCDPAGIVFYPRYFEMFSEITEDWCARGLGISFREMHIVRGLGLPVMRIETDFLIASELGELLRADLRVEKLGAASMTLAIALRGPAGEERVRAKLVVALMDLAKRRAVPIDDALRSRILPFCIIPG